MPNAQKVKESFKKRGETIKSWCEAREYEPTYVSRILMAQSKPTMARLTKSLLSLA